LKNIKLGLILVIFIGIVVLFVNFALPSKEQEDSNENEITEKEVEAVAEPVLNQNEEKEQTEYNLKLKELVKNQFEYFDTIVNGSYFRNFRGNGPDGNYPDGWVSNKVKNELSQRALEIDELLPENINDPISQDLINVLVRINQTSSLLDTQKNVYQIHRTLYNLHVDLNGYELEEGKFDPENDWNQVFGEEIDQSVKTEEEIKMRNLETEAEIMGE
jgi:hypothetical protein